MYCHIYCALIIGTVIYNVTLLFVLSYILCPYYLYCHIYCVLIICIVIYTVSLLFVLSYILCP